MARDNIKQSEIAKQELASASLVAVSLSSLCELVWVLSTIYNIPREKIAAAIRALSAGGNVSMNRPAVEAGLKLLEAGGDFADGVIAFEGRWLGGETFVSFDKQAVKLLKSAGEAARLLA